jgi:hypothetical protein
VEERAVAGPSEALIGAAAVVTVAVLVLAAITGGLLAPGARRVLAGASQARPRRHPPGGDPDDTITLSGVGDVIMGSAPGSLPRNGGPGSSIR